MLTPKNILSSPRVNVAKNIFSFPYPNLIQSQLDSYKKFLEVDLKEIFSEINPVDDNTGRLWKLEFLDYRIDKANRTIREALRKGLTYDAAMYYKIRLTNKQTGELKEQDIYFGDIPLMTNYGTFVVNGNERIVVHQIIRAEGVIYLESSNLASNRKLYMCKIMPMRGSWFTIDLNKNGVMTIRLGPKRPKINVATFLRAIGYSSNAEILNLFSDCETDPDFKIMEATLAKDSTTNSADAIIDVYRRLRTDVSATLDSAKQYIENLLFNEKRTWMGRVGRYQMNKKLEEKYKKEPIEENYVLFSEDIIGIIRKLVKINNGTAFPDDIDHLGNRRIRAVNELLGESIRVATRKIEKNIKDKMSIRSTDELLVPADLVSARPFMSSFIDFFGTNPLSRFADQKNILAQLANLREVTASGPGGITAERATFSVRDMHYSQYGRFCMCDTPEGPNVGLVNRFSVYARINDYGFIEAPYYKIQNSINLSKKPNNKIIINRVLEEDLKNGSKVILKKGTKITKDNLETILNSKLESIDVRPFVTDEVVYMDPDTESAFVFTQSTVNMDDDKNLMDEIVSARNKDGFTFTNTRNVNFIDVAPNQPAGVTFSMLPFGQNDDAVRSVYATAQIKQAVPLLNAEPPVIGTGFETLIAQQSGRCLYAETDGSVDYVDASKIVIKSKDGKEEYDLTIFNRSNEDTLIHQSPTVSPGQKVKKGDLLAEGAEFRGGESSIGTNLLATAMIYEGYNFEDGFIISERVVRERKLSSILVKEYTQEIRDTKLGPEILTSDLPGASENALKKLDPNGVVRPGAYVVAGDILAAIAAPKGEVELSAEEKLLRAIFGDQAKDVRDASLKMPNGEYGIVIDTQILDRIKQDKLSAGVLKQVKVWVAKMHNIGLGDKLADMNGGKGVISKILPEEDMPHLADGTPIDIMMNAFYVKRMNMGLLKEMWWSNIANTLGIKLALPLFSMIDNLKVEEMLKKADVTVTDKYKIYDGRTGEEFDNEVSLGTKYILKLKHLADEKIHARSIGPYTIVTQQPLGGKAQFGGQRFGEMEVWALEAHGAAHILQEMLTIKSDDIRGRSQAYESIVHGQPIKIEGTPESFKVFINELRALVLNPQPIGIHAVNDSDNNSNNQ